MRRTSSWVSLLLVAVAIPFSAIAQNAFTLRDTDVYAGPSSEYPPVVTLPPNVGVNIAGCLNDWSWCDVIFGDSRGWVYAADLGYPYGSNRVVILEYGPRLGIPIVAFSLPVYWQAHYRARPWYRERDQWVTRVHVEANHGGRPPEGRAVRTERPSGNAQAVQPGQPPQAPQPPQTARSPQGAPQVTQPTQSPQWGQTSQRERPREESTRPSQAQQLPPTTPRSQGTPPSDAVAPPSQERQRPQAAQPAQSAQAGRPSEGRAPEGRPPEGRPSEKRPPEGRPPETARPQESAAQHEGGRAPESGRQQQENKREAEGRKPPNDPNNDRDKQ